MPIIAGVVKESGGSPYQGFRQMATGTGRDLIPSSMEMAVLEPDLRMFTPCTAGPAFVPFVRPCTGHPLPTGDTVRGALYRVICHREDAYLLKIDASLFPATGYK